MNGKKDKKPFSDPRWREWPKTGIKFGGKANPEVKAFLDKYFAEEDKKDKK